MKTHCSNAQKWFLASTPALLAFGELAYVLDSCVDSWMDEWKALAPGSSHWSYHIACVVPQLTAMTFLLAEQEMNDALLT